MAEQGAHNTKEVSSILTRPTEVATHGNVPNNHRRRQDMEVGRMISLDTEDTGVDLYFGSAPFLVTICDESNPTQPDFWEWDVDPVTRAVNVPDEHILEIRQRVEEADFIVTQNGKFDTTALAAAGIIIDWPWEKTLDTLMAGHLLGTGLSHTLDAMAIQYLGRDIRPLEDTLKKVCQDARRLARKHFKHWRIAKEGLPDMPSVTSSSKRDEDKPWKNDTWLPREIARAFKYPKDDPFWTVTSDYANADSAVTLALWPVMEEEIRRRNLWAIFLERMKLLPVAYNMEKRGVTVSYQNMVEMQTEFERERDRAIEECKSVGLSYGYELEVPAGAAANNSLRHLCFDILDLPRVTNPKAKTDAPTLDKNAREYYLASLPPESDGYKLIKSLSFKAARDTALGYMASYERFWMPLGVFDNKGEQLYYLLRPNLNPTGTNTLRWSCYNPNEQNISKRGIEIRCRTCQGRGDSDCPVCKGEGTEPMTTRHMFGPAPGREWWSLDFKNVERRIPVFKAGQQEIIDLFEKPDEPPYYGSEHLLVAHVLHKKEFEECRDSDRMIDGRLFKKKYNATLYQWVKNGNFAIQYGAMQKTAEATYRVKGAYEQIKSRFKALDKLNQHCINFANKHGYIETEPDRDVDPARGFPIMCSRSGWGEISPTIPLNYYSSGTAMWLTGKAMVRCQDKLDEWREQTGFDGHLVLQIHDEQVFDFPKSKVHPTEDMPAPRSRFRAGQSNLWRVRILQEIVAKCGDGVGIPTPCGAEYNEHNWGDGVTL